MFFLFGGRAIHEFAGVERLQAEVIGIAIAVACGFGGFIAKKAIEDVEWEEANEAGYSRTVGMARPSEVSAIVPLFITISPCRTH